MGQLVGVEAARRADRLGCLRVEGLVGEGGEARVLHPARYKILNRHLIVLAPRIGDADVVLEEGHDRGGVLEGVDRLGRRRRLRVEAERHVAVTPLELGEIAGDETDQIAHMGLLLDPLHPLQTSRRVDFLSHLAAIGEDRHLRRHVADDLGRGAFVGIVVAGEPVPGLVRFPLRPDMRVAGRIAHVRRAEVEPAAGLGFVLDVERDLPVDRDRLGEADDHRAARHGVIGDRHVGLHPMDSEIDSIEPELLERLGDRLERQARRAADRVAGEVGGDIDADVEHVDGPVGGIAPAIPGIVDRRPEGILARLVPMEEPPMAAASVFLLGNHRAGG